ncbi:hypothetical protein CIK05_12015 [Bdellovibrio sp. qaytius]|nr:hypothetical protein CIK05_12015 [Bdellovibrio sp. qaytius]
MQKAILVGPCLEPKSRKLSFNDDTVIIFVDGGIKHLKTQFKKATQWISIGDQDSGSTKPKVKLKKDKNESDLFHALKLLPKDISVVETYGLFPDLKNEARLDHRLFNLGEIFRASAKSGAIFILNDHEVLLPAGNHQLDFKGEFSLVCFSKTKIRLTGKVKYPLQKATQVDMLSSRTLSNVGSGLMKLECNHPLLLNNID